jgi:ABC-type glycerol-3-phosphate transport system permease component
MFIGPTGRTAVVIGSVAPFAWQVLTSLKSLEELYRVPPTLWPSSPSVEAYVQVLQARPFLGYLS